MVQHHHEASSSTFKPSMPPSFSSSPFRVFRFISFSLSRSHHNSRHCCCINTTLSIFKPFLLPPSTTTTTPTLFPRFQSVQRYSVSAAEEGERVSGVGGGGDSWGFGDVSESETFVFSEDDGGGGGVIAAATTTAASDLKKWGSGFIEVKELEEFPEQWRRSRLAWLCKELPGHKAGTLIRILNAQRKWIAHEDAKYIVVHIMRIRESETAFRVYKWMIQQHWFQFDFDLATKLADFLGKERKFSKCRDVFDDIINQGQVPSESTFHILTVAYLSSTIQGCLEEACGIYNRMIQFGGYKPRVSLHHSLFRALVSKPGGTSKYHLKQAEFIFHNLDTHGLEIHKDIYAGLIWLHSYQEVVDTERIAALRGEMQQHGLEEGTDILVSTLRAYSKQGNVEGTEQTWLKLLASECSLPSQAFVYRMEVYAKVGDHMKSLHIFRGMQDHIGFTGVVAYHKIIEVMSKAQELEITETLMGEFMERGLKPLMPSFIDLMQMYSNMSLHEKLEVAFYQCLEKCHPNRTVYNIYLDSLVKIGNYGKASEIFNQMQSNGTIGINSRSCNTILSGYLSCGEHIEAEKIYDLMCQKKYDIEPSLMEKVEYFLSLKRKVIKKPISLKLSKEQREILVGLLLGGLRIESDEERRKHALHFEFDESSMVHFVLKRHIHDEFHEWVNRQSRSRDEHEAIPNQFSTIGHSYFGFYADQFWPKGQPVIPKLIHRWLSSRVLAYWYMYGGHRTSSGDILLKLKGGSREDVEKVVKTLKAKSLDCRVKRNGKVFWIGFLGNNSLWFWKLIDPYILDDLKDPSRAEIQSSDNRVAEEQHINFDSDTDCDGNVSDSNDK